LAQFLKLAANYVVAGGLLDWNKNIMP